MNNEFLFLFKKRTDTMIEQTKTKPEETLVLKQNKQMETFSFNPPLNLSEEGKCFLAVTSFKASNSVFIITNENNSCSISTPSYWTPESGEEFIKELTNLLKPRSQNGIELQVKEVEK